MPANKMGPPCPSCGSHLTDVVSTNRTADRGFWRLRKCPACDHRFHTVQQPEMVVVDGTVTWLADSKGKHRTAQVDWRWYEAG
jgi:transcriptional regulator NrdR family protein